MVFNTKSTSYGILCVTAKEPHYILLNHSFSYPSMQILLKKGNKSVRLNSQETYNIFLSAFPGYVGEGEYTLPRGKIDAIDQNQIINTKIREFIEETKLHHPKFKSITEYPYYDDCDAVIREKWIGLDGKQYFAEYTVFVINNTTDLIPATFDTLCNDYSFIKNAHPLLLNRYKKKYKYDSEIDNFKSPMFIPLELGLKLIKIHRQEEILNLNAKVTKNIIASIINNNNNLFFFK